MDFFCVDNLPIALLPKFLELSSASMGEYSKIALVMDLREKDFSGPIGGLSPLGSGGYQLEISSWKLRRGPRPPIQPDATHPSPGGGRGAGGGIQKEREVLAPYGPWQPGHGYLHLQCPSASTGHSRALWAETAGRRMALTFLSFGYSHGIPQEADLVMDVRFLPNPFFVEELKICPGPIPGSTISSWDSKSPGNGSSGSRVFWPIFCPV